MGHTSMKVAVYDRYWNTMGGGEVYAGTIAEVLSQEHEVTLLAEAAFDLDLLQARLGMDLSRSTSMVLGEISDDEFRSRTSDYDVFFNCTFGSTRPSGAQRSVYVVYFPPVEGGSTGVVRALLSRTVGQWVSGAAQVEWRHGFHAEEASGDLRWRWTTGAATLLIRSPKRAEALVRLRLSTAARPAAAQAPVQVRVGPAVVGGVDAGVAGTFDVTFPLQIGPYGSAVEVVTTPFSPGAYAEVDDDRTLGVQMEGVEVRRQGPVAAGAALVQRALALPKAPVGHLADYDTVVAISRFTQRWIWRRWGRSSRLLHPPVRPRDPSAKESVILSVGRFFGRESGHSKKQLEMVSAFRRLLPHLNGDWSLHLVGGCSEADRAYLDDVRCVADGLPVHIHANAPASLVDGLYGRARLYWHMTGVGEDPRLHPERFEHFGISVVEAMSAGAVPLVFGSAGPAEIVRHGRDGIHVASLDELVTKTAELIAASGRMEELARSARERASQYGPDAFSTRLASVVFG